MEHFNAYLQELLALEIRERVEYRTKSGLYSNKEEIPKGEKIEKVFETLDIGHYSSGYDYKLALHEQNAINECLTYQEYQKHAFLTRIKRIKENFELFLERDFEELSDESHHPAKYSEAKFLSKIGQLFLNPMPKLKAIDPLFKSSLERLIRAKIFSTQSFIGEIVATFSSNDPLKKYTAVEIIDFAEWSLRFIRKKFRTQLEIKLSHPEHMEPGRLYGREDMTQIREVNSFYISTELPLFDFTSMKNAIRELLLSANNKDELQTILGQCKRYADENIDMYNDYVSYLEKLTVDGKGIESDPPEELKNVPVIRQTVHLSIDESRSVMTVTPYGLKRFQRQSVELYTNYNFAVYSLDVYNLLLSEVYKEQSAIEKKVSKAGHPLTFEELFYDQTIIPKCVQALKLVKNPVLSEDDTYRLGDRSKGSIVAWLALLEEKGKIRSGIPRELQARLLSNFIKGFTISAKALQSCVHNTPFKKYKKSLEPYIN